MGKGKTKKILLYVFAGIFIYSMLPLIFLYLTPESSKENNNQSNIQKLKGNDGSYFSFIVFGDNHAGLIFNDSSAMKLIWHMNREDRFRKIPIDFVASVGDVTLDGARGHYKTFKKLQALIKWPFVTAIGNHDSRDLFEEYCGVKDFSFVNRNSYFIFLDNEIGNLSDEQFSWFIAELQAGAKEKHIFVFLHKPPFDPYQQEWYNMDNQPWAYKFRKLCEEYAVDMVFSGHKHMFKHEKFGNVDYIVTGGGGMLIEIPESDGGYLHYVRVMVNNDYVTYETRKIDPPFWEFVTYYFWKELIYIVRDLYGTGYIFNKNNKHQKLKVSDLNNREYWLDVFDKI
ncbi:MAG: metallophosphoesterase [Candidatus Omnitrophica bacterium]|nr:metallophosphoesterase [Candidatus Omnitrophota bacterium]